MNSSVNLPRPSTLTPFVSKPMVVVPNVPAPVTPIIDEFEFDFAMCHGSYYYCRYHQY